MNFHVESRCIHDLVSKTATDSSKRLSVHSDKFVKGNTEISYIHNGYLMLDDMNWEVMERVTSGNSTCVSRYQSCMCNLSLEIIIPSYLRSLKLMAILGYEKRTK